MRLYFSVDRKAARRHCVHFLQLKLHLNGSMAVRWSRGLIQRVTASSYSSVCGFSSECDFPVDFLHGNLSGGACLSDVLAALPCPAAGTLNMFIQTEQPRNLCSRVRKHSCLGAWCECCVKPASPRYCKAKGLDPYILIFVCQTLITVFEIIRLH